ncbi:hypothetical protein CEE37_12570 [candidate division LCP-89 bacterium B3_LCP]|uniref:Glycosyltransferase RgtA/B/C/D-like domain-containing protein n=1 Tax=candidate division LCP-89 bacterium B3_LCP TaxID=2012998 RepID=A0A532UUH4_UNCL8|nr:MAG: hypothetical protein CEE37_12570 [candidate division LCP-89 bacterium B3_LCP]
MQRFAKILIIVGGIFLIGGLLMPILAFDPIKLQGVLTSDGHFDSIAYFVFSELQNGLILAGITLIILAILFLLCQREIIKLFSWPQLYFLLLVLAIQFILGLIYITAASYIPDGDYDWYHRQASNISKGLGVITILGEPTAFWGVGYPLLLSIFYKIFGADPFVAKVLNLFLFGGITLFSFLVAEKLFGGHLARRATLIMAFLPSAIFYAITPTSEAPLTLCTIIILYLTLRKSSIINSLLIGILLGYANLVRAVLIFFPVIIGIFVYLRDGKLKPALLHILLIFTVAEVVMLPWQVRNYKVFDSFVLSSTNSGYNVYMGNNPGATGGVNPPGRYISSEDRLKMTSMNEVERDKYFYKMGIQYMLSNPGHVLILSLKKVIHLFIKDSKCVTYAFNEQFEQFNPAILMSLLLITEGYYYSLGIAFLIGFFFLMKYKSIRERIWIIIGTILYFILIYLPFTAEGRYHMPLLPLFAIVACLPKFIDKQNEVKQIA